jgi:hypothetical protein
MDSQLDTFFDFTHCVNRLHNEWKKHPKLLIACDFDDTVFDFHQRNQSHQMVIDLLKKCNELGFYVTLFTASKPHRYDSMREHMESLGVKIDAINQNVIELPYGNNGKIYYNILLDDRAGLWEAVRILTSVISKIENNEK